MIEEASRIPGFCVAYTAGSTNWLSDDAELSTASDLDIMVVLADQNHAGRRHKFIYRDVFLEVSYLGNDQLQSPDQVLSDYHLAPSFRTTNILIDPSGHLAALLAMLNSCAAGITVADPETYPNIGHFARLHDPDGNPIELWQPA